MPTITIRGIIVDFPFKPYSVQVDYMTKVIEALQSGQNAVLESPTGTGKTLCLLCSTLAWRKAEISRLKETVSTETEKLPEGLSAWGEANPNEDLTAKRIPKIIYASRTHSQLTQVVNELKRTAYGKKIVVSLLGSREQMCIHPEVSRQSNNQTMVHMCRNKVNKHLCHFYNNVEDARKNNIFANEVLDIEDLVSLGKRRNVCPYYGAREMSKQADCGIIFTPYNYLLDRKSRRSHNLEINGNIIIFDEAHNLEKQCEESASFDVTSLDFANCIEEVGDLLNAVTKLSETGAVPHGHEAGETSALSEFNKEELALMKNFFLALEKCLDEIELPPSTKSKAEPGRFIFEYFRNVNLTFDTFEVLLEVMDKISNYLSTLSNAFRTRGTALQKFSEIIKTVFSASDPKSNQLFGSNPGLGRQNIEEMSKFYRVHICEDDAKLKKDIWKKEKKIAAKPSRTLSYWCFSPGYAMRDLMSSGVRNLILTSGTLSPIDSFTSELQVDFPITLENDHVIDRHQVFVASLTTGLNGGRLEATFKSRSDEQKVVELGRTLVEMLKRSPGGTLVFFPSYAAMAQYTSLWKEKSNVMEMFDLVKPCTIEPRAKNELRETIQKYYSDVKSPEGGALFAVCRGKVSEGLDFANDNGRTVIIIGIPFPPWLDPKVKLKMSFLDDLKRSGSSNTIQGNEWYRQQACRAVNQAIGRVIRHRYDYGSIILCDHRYTRKDQLDELPKWIQCHVTNFDDCPKFLRRLKSFFCSIREKEKIRLGANSEKEAEEVAMKKVDNTPGTSQGISFSKETYAKKQEFMKNIPKYNELIVHHPNGSYSIKKQERADMPKCVCEGHVTFVDPRKRKRSPVTSQSKTKKTLFDALDEHDADVISDDDNDENLGEAEAHRISTQLLVMDKRIKDEYANKRKKIKLKPPSFTTSTPIAKATDDVRSKEEKVRRKLVTLDQLLRGPPKLYLDTLRETLDNDKYMKFKDHTGRYKKNGDVEKLVSGFSEFFTQTQMSRDLLKCFVRFVRSEHQSRYNELIESLIYKDKNGN